MKHINLTRTVGVAMLALATVSVASATQYDVAVSRTLLPVSSPKQTQAVSFEITNVGEKPLESFLAGARKNGKKIGEDYITLDTPLQQNETMTVTLEETVELEYGFTDKIEVYAQLTDAIDDDASNNTVSYDVTMPWLMDFPYRWSDENASTDFIWPDPWTFNPDAGTFRYVGTKQNLTSDLTSGVFDLGEGRDVKCSLVYNCSDTVVITVLTDNGDEEAVLGEVQVPGNGGNYTECAVFGHASGFVQFKLRFSFPNNPKSYVVINLSNIEFSESGIDMRATEILSPTVPNIALNGKIDIAARFDNLSAAAISNPVFCYSVGGKEVKETYEGTVESGRSIDYVFNTPLVPDTEGKHGIKVWCEVAGDTDPSNNELQSGEINFYAPMAFPYRTGFDSGNDLWTLIDGAGKGWVWQFGTLDDGNNILGYPASYGSYDAIAITPAVAVTQGRHRLSFYYSGISGGAHLKVMAGTEPDIDRMSEVLFDEDVDQNGWRQGYALFDAAETGNLYLAFHLTGGNDQVVVDNLSVDSDDDLCIGTVAFDAKSDFNLTGANVSVAVMNHGINPQSGIEVAYSLNDGTKVTETIAETINPGETVEHTFAAPVDISKSGETYQLTGYIVTEIGEDRFNDSAKSAPLYHYANCQIPYSFSFSDPFRVSQWRLDQTESAGQWSVKIAEGDYMNISGNYDDGGSLKFVNNGNNDNDAWAFSECIEIPAGTYELTYFYRTAPGWSTDAYRQNFRLMLGDRPEAAAMSLEMSRHEDVLESNGYRKYNGFVTVPEDGRYYIGVHAFGPRANGHIQLDALAIEPISEPEELPWEADFAAKADEWYHYNPGEWHIQWAYSEEQNAMVASRYTSIDTAPDGLLVSPKLLLKKGKKATLEFTYSLTGEPENITFNVYKASVNNPDAFTMIGSYSKSSQPTTVSYEFDAPEADTEVYIGFRTVHDYDIFTLTEKGYTAAIHSVNMLTESGGSGVCGIDSDALRVEGGMLVANDAAAEINVYAVSGTLMAVGTGSVSVSGLKGVHIVTVGTDGNVQRIKVAL